VPRLHPPSCAARRRTRRARDAARPRRNAARGTARQRRCAETALWRHGQRRRSALQQPM
jgi:hypothetical protein